MKIKPITQQDADKAYETVKDNGNPQYGDKTYALELCRFDDGKALYFCAGTLYDGDEFDHYCRLGIENPRAVLADFEFDYPMPWDPNNEYGDVIDTELSLPIGQDDVEWLNEKANDIANGYESGELVASSRKAGKNRPLKSSVGSEEAQIKQLTNPETFWDDVRSIVGYGTGRFHEDWDIKHLQRVADKRYEELTSSRKNRRSVKSSRKPIQSMYVTQDISGMDLYTCLWSGGKDQFDSMIEDGADPDDILNACEELLFREEGNPPTMTELNDLIWFEPDTIRDYIGLSNPIESGCHGRSKKGKKKAVKSAKKSVKSAYNPWNGEGSIRVSLEVVEDGEHSSPDFSNTVMDLDDFVAECKSYAESCNGYYFVSENDSNSYKIEFRTGDDSFTDNPGTDPYYEESCGIVIAELIYPYTTDMADYIENA